MSDEYGRQRMPQTFKPNDRIEITNICGLPKASYATNGYYGNPPISRYIGMKGRILIRVDRDFYIVALDGESERRGFYQNEMELRKD